ncbi:hypothetical protein A1O3_03333 [Capronia epimyces CBS 606.96]|uniref:Uncharacterized protein n=1 Tax=Capronia epimyces CBS 606.96 TaxID=1182542 RepID=W9Y0S6_9EURO|nr:uncharacterized protein A1O3_03333 [Capronia epimyces CBS 606.96]EXJ86382.1 hypothetical protein A1O3_03333 [Capronia epimyces CBS 606.96]
MSGVKAVGGSEASGTTGDEIPPQHNNGASVSRHTSGRAARESDHQEIIAGLGLPFLARVSKGRLNVSEASVPAPQRSEVSVQGQVFSHSHQHPSEWDSEAVEIPGNDEQIVDLSRDRQVPGAFETPGNDEQLVDISRDRQATEAVEIPGNNEQIVDISRDRQAPEAVEIPGNDEQIVDMSQDRQEPEAVETPGNDEQIVDLSQDRKAPDSEIASEMHRVPVHSGPVHTKTDTAQEPEADHGYAQQSSSGATGDSKEDSGQPPTTAERVKTVSLKSVPDKGAFVPGEGAFAHDEGAFVPDEDQGAFVPGIQVHRPSATVTATAREPSSVDSMTAPSSLVPTAPPPTPVGVPATPQDAVQDPLLAASAPKKVATDPSTPTKIVSVDAINDPNAVPVDRVSHESSRPHPGPTNPHSTSRIGRYKRLLRRARRLLVTKQVLNFVIGRDLANSVHPQLQQSGTDSVRSPLPMDGPSDFLSAYSRRRERKGDARRKRVEGRIAAARAHAEAEELEKCPNCRGLTNTRYYRAYHRLQLKRERPDMRMVDRHVAARARVAGSKCRCRNGRRRSDRCAARGGDVAAPREALPREALAEDETSGPGPVGGLSQ